jgi:hypothetical protein
MTMAGNPEIVRDIKLLLTLEDNPKSKGTSRKVQQDLQGIVDAYDRMMKKFRTPIGSNQAVKTLNEMFDTKKMREFVKLMNDANSRIDIMRRKLEHPMRMKVIQDGFLPANSGFLNFDRQAQKVQLIARANQAKVAQLAARQQAYAQRAFNAQLAAAQATLGVPAQQGLLTPIPKIPKAPNLMQRLGTHLSGKASSFMVAAGGPWGLAASGLMKAGEFITSRVASVFMKSVDMMKGLFFNLGTKLTAMVTALGLAKSAIDGLILNNQEMINKLRLDNLLKMPQNINGMNKEDMDKLLDTFVRSTTFNRNELYDAISSAMLLGVNTKELPGILAQGGNIAAARGQNLTDAVRNLVYMVKFGLQDEFRRATGFTSFVGEDPMARNARVNRYLNERFGGQAGILAQADVFGRFRQQWTELSRNIMAGPFMQISDVLQRVNDTLIGLNEMSQFKFQGVSKDGTPTEMTLFEVAFKSIFDPIVQFFASGKLWEIIKNAINVMFEKILKLQVALELTKWELVIGGVMSILPNLIIKTLGSTMPVLGAAFKAAGIQTNSTTDDLTNYFKNINFTKLPVSKLVMNELSNLGNGTFFTDPNLQQSVANAQFMWQMFGAMLPAAVTQAKSANANYQYGTNVVTAPDAAQVGNADTQYQNAVAVAAKRNTKGTGTGNTYSGVKNVANDVQDGNINSMVQVRAGQPPYQRYQQMPGPRTVALGY